MSLAWLNLTSLAPLIHHLWETLWKPTRLVCKSKGNSRTKTFNMKAAPQNTFCFFPKGFQNCSTTLLSWNMYVFVLKNWDHHDVCICVGDCVRRTRALIFGILHIFHNLLLHIYRYACTYVAIIHSWSKIFRNANGF